MELEQEALPGGAACGLRQQVGAVALLAAAGFGSVQPFVAAVERIQGGFGVKRVPDRLAGRGIRHAATSGDDGHACIKNRDRRSVLDTWQTPGRSGMTLGIVLFLVNLKVIYGAGAWIGGGFME
ncbi:hypothetical protein LHK_00486 [Laribacter hongkongensis HLHK9]|uniref:Uncharacterized protein n=1 Tax=Laribacter hongkongensis (strain HLHK9) TaxID=557598 RepID=C1DC62_LARHH|nr:hypothetical protein LHK_00486 [Laribacter hongkongensis HLHK9]